MRRDQEAAGTAGWSIVEGRPGLIVRHSQERQKRVPFHAIVIRQTIAAQNIAICPKSLEELGRVVGHGVSVAFE